MKSTIYELVTNSIIQSLNKAVVPWRKPWNGQDSLPSNLITGKAYRGINLFLLTLTPYLDHRWLTMRQVQERGGSVRKGEKAQMVIFWKHLEPTIDPETGEILRVQAPVLRYYHVFNVEQCEKLSIPKLEGFTGLSEKVADERADLLVSQMPNPPKLQVGHSAWYRPRDDLVQVPPMKNFVSSQSYYATVFHELGHATGHEKRLNRSGVTGEILFGSGEYSKEELVAELTSAFCCAVVGLDNSFIKDAASYIYGWLKVLRSDSKAVVIAAAQAQRAADYIRGVSY